MINSIPTKSMLFNNLNDVSFDKAKTYSSIEQFGSALIKYGTEQTKIYADKFAKQENAAKSSIEDLKNEIKNEFSSYKLVSSEPVNVMDGQHLLYIDENNLQKMANDSEYKAKVFGLMKREHDSLSGNKIKMGSEVINFSMTGSVFSLSNSNESVGGIPFKGSATSSSFSTGTTKTSNVLDSGNDWFKEMLEKLKEKMLEDRREETRVQKTTLNVYA